MESQGLPCFATLTPANGLASRSLEALHAHLAGSDVNIHHARFVHRGSLDQRSREAAATTLDALSPAPSSHLSFESTTTEADLLPDQGTPIDDQGHYVLGFHKPLDPALGWVMGSGRFDKDGTNGCVNLLLYQPETQQDEPYHRPPYPRHLLFKFDSLGRLWLTAKHNRVVLNGINLAPGERRLLRHSEVIDISGLKFMFQSTVGDDKQLAHKAALDTFLGQQYPEPPPEVTSATPSTNDVQIGEWVVHGIVGSTPTSVIEAASHRRTGQAVAVKRMLRKQQTAKKVDAELAIYDHLLPRIRMHEYGKFVMKKHEWLAAGPAAGLTKEILLLWTPLARLDLHQFRCSHSFQSTPAEVKLQLFCQALLGAQALHDLGWIHRDLKPKNIAIVSVNPPHALIIDLGAAVESSSKCIPTPGTCGSLGWIAPELENSAYVERYGQKVDVWSMGAVGVFLVQLGTIPWSAEGNMFLPHMESIAPLQPFRDYHQELGGHSPRSIQGLLYQMLRVLHKSRPGMREVLAHPALQLPFEARRKFLEQRKGTGNKRRLV